MHARVTHASIVLSRCPLRRSCALEERVPKCWQHARTFLWLWQYALAGRAATVLEGDPFLGHVREPTQRIEIFAFVTLRVSETAVMK